MTHDAQAGPEGTGPDRPAPASRTRTLVAALLGLLLLAGIVVAGLSWPTTTQAADQDDVRRDVIRVAEQFTVQVNNYDASSIATYQESIEPLLSTKFRSEFEKSMTDIVTQVEEAEMVSQGEVLASAVASADDDSARVLVVADADVKTVFDTRERHFRWEITLVRSDGEWLVDDFNPVV